MQFWQHIHWYLTDRCNLDCTYCFAPRIEDNIESTERLSLLAKILVDNEIERVTITGGEPTLVKGLENVLQILREANIYTSLHTNGTTISRNRIQELKELVDEIAIPIDSMKAESQRELRGIDYLPMFEMAIKEIQEAKIDLVYHTVATAFNVNDLPEIYQRIIDTRFRQWKIYEFNSAFVQKKFSGIKNWRTFKKLQGRFNYEKGCTDCLAAKMLLVEEEMKMFADPRIQFGWKNEVKPPYVFLDNSGDVRFCTWYSQKRAVVGNLLKEKFSAAKEKLQQANRDGPFFDEDEFVEANNDLPIWARLYEGNFIDEEIEIVKSEYRNLTAHLAELHNIRTATRQQQYPPYVSHG